MSVQKDNLEKVIETSFKTALKQLKNQKLNSTQTQLFQRLQSKVTKSASNSLNGKIEYPDAVKRAYNLTAKKLSKNEETKFNRIIDLEDSSIKGEDEANYYIKKKSKLSKNANEIIISSESVSEQDIEEQKNEQNLLQYDEIYRGIQTRVQNNQASQRKRRKRKRFDQAALQRQLSELDIEYEETKVEIPFEIPKSHTKERQLDHLFPDFSIKFLNDLNKQTFGKTNGMFNKCYISAQPNLYVYTPFDTHYLNFQNEICNTSNNKEGNRQYLSQIQLNQQTKIFEKKF